MNLPNVEVSPNFRCPGGHCLELCRPLGSNDGGIGLSFGPLQDGTLPELHFGFGFLRLAGTSGSELLPIAATARAPSSSISSD